MIVLFIFSFCILICGTEKPFEHHRLHRFNNKAGQEKISQQFQQIHSLPEKSKELPRRPPHINHPAPGKAPHFLKNHFGHANPPRGEIPEGEKHREIPDENLRKIMRKLRRKEIPELPDYVSNGTDWEKDLLEIGQPGHRYADLLLEEIKLLEEDDERTHELLAQIQQDDTDAHEELQEIELDDEETHQRLKEVEADDKLVHVELREIQADDRHAHELLKHEEAMMGEVHDEALEEGFLNGLATPFAVVGFFTILYLSYRIYKKAHEVAHEMLFVEGGYTKLARSIDDDDADLVVPGNTISLETELTSVTQETLTSMEIGDVKAKHSETSIPV